MIVDQAEIDALLAEAQGLAAEAADELAAPEAPPPPPPPRAPLQTDDARLQRLLHIRVPVIVQLASRHMPISAVCALSVGAIIEFEKNVEEPLDLLVNDRPIGHGHCVKVGEYFGLRVTEICDRADRIRSLGGRRA